jgi:PAS domain S-box-containing protein
MRLRRSSSVVLVLVLATAAIIAAVFHLRARSVDVHSGIIQALAELGSAEARLDSDVLKVVSLRLPHYDTVVGEVRQIGDDTRRLELMIREGPYGADSGIIDAARAYVDRVHQKIAILEDLKGTAAFLRNEVTYIPFAVSQAAAKAGEPEALELAELSQRLLSFHALPSDEGRHALAAAIASAEEHPRQDAAATSILGHMRVYLQQHERLDAALRDYFAIDSQAGQADLRNRLLARHARDQQRIQMVIALLCMLGLGLFAALAWTVRSLVEARNAAEHAWDRLADAVRHLHGAFALFDGDRRLVMFNSKLAEFYPPLAGIIAPGLRYERMLHVVATSGYVRDAAPDPQAWVQRHLAGSSHALPTTEQVADGRWFLCSDRPTSNGGLVFVRNDITRQTVVEDRLRRLSTAVEQSPVSIVITDLAGAILYVNPRFCEVTGYTEAEVLGANPRLLKSGEMPHLAYRDMWRTIAGGEVWKGEFHNRKKNGDLYWESALISPIRDETGHICGYVGVKEDITRQKADAARLRLTVDELARSNAELEQFAYVSSHDLREPLRTISSYVTLLERRYGDRLDDDAREFIAYAKDGARRMDQLILDLLEFSRIGRHSGPPSPVDLGAAVAQACTNLRGAIEASGATVTVSPDLPVVVGNHGELVRLFQNLIGNAVKYRKPSLPPAVRIEWRRDGREWIVSVVDNGIGIAPEYFDRIFRIFQRLHTRDEYEGTGIGLAICKKIMEHHGGRIWVEPVDDGCTVSVALPAG